MCDHFMKYLVNFKPFVTTKMVFDDVKRKRVLKASVLLHCWRQIGDVFILRKFLSRCHSKEKKRCDIKATNKKKKWRNFSLSMQNNR